jgi:hypothetical protein
MAKRVIDFAAGKGLALTMGQLYGLEPLPTPQPKEVAAASATSQEA